MRETSPVFEDLKVSTVYFSVSYVYFRFLKSLTLYISVNLQSLKNSPQRTNPRTIIARLQVDVPSSLLNSIQPLHNHPRKISKLLQLQQKRNPLLPPQPITPQSLLRNTILLCQLRNHSRRMKTSTNSIKHLRTSSK